MLNGPRIKSPIYLLCMGLLFGSTASKINKRPYLRHLRSLVTFDPIYICCKSFCLEPCATSKVVVIVEFGSHFTCVSFGPVAYKGLGLPHLGTCRLPNLTSIVGKVLRGPRARSTIDRGIGPRFLET